MRGLACLVLAACAAKPPPPRPPPVVELESLIVDDAVGLVRHDALAVALQRTRLARTGPVLEIAFESAAFGDMFPQFAAAAAALDGPPAK